MDKIAYFFILWGMFVSCSLGYDIEINDNNEDEQNASNQSFATFHLRPE